MARDASSSASETRAKLSKWEKPMQEVLRRGNGITLDFFHIVF